MIRVELYLNGQQMDINEAKDFGLRINKIISSSNDLSKRGGLYTFTIKIPKTDNNNKALKHINNFQQTGKFNIKEKIEAEVYINGESLLIGTFLISQITPENYEGVIYGQDISWIDEMEGRTLKQIESFPSKPFEGVDTTNGYSIQDYTNNVIAGTENIISFPILGYGNFFDGSWVDGNPLNTINEVTVEELPPAVFEKSILQYLFQDYGYNIKTGLEDLVGTIWNDYILPYVGSEPYPWNWGTLSKWLGVENTTDTINVSKAVYDEALNQYSIGVGLVKVSAKLKQITNFQIDADYWNDGTLDEYLVRKEGFFDFDLNQFNIITGFDSTGFNSVGFQDWRNAHTRLIIVKNYQSGDLTTEQIVEQASSTQIIANEWVNERYSNGGTITTRDFSLTNVIANDVDLEVGDVIQVFAVCVEQVDGATTNGIGTNFTNYKLDIDIQNEPTEINPALGLPEIDQKDFIKGLLNRYNLFFKYNPDSRTITFQNRSIFFKTKDLFIDLDQNCNIEEFDIVPIQIPAVERYNWLNDSSDYYLQQDSEFANTEIVNNNIYAKGELNIILPYAPTKLRTYDFTLPTGGEAELPSIAGEDEIFTPLNEVEKNYSFEPRLLRIKRFTESNIRFTISGVTVLWHTALFSNTEWTEASGEGVGFYAYWNLPRKDNSNLIKGSAWLNVDQWKKLNNNYYVEIGGDRYRVETIEAFDPQKRNPTKLTLLKEV